MIKEQHNVHQVQSIRPQADFLPFCLWILPPAVFGGRKAPGQILVPVPKGTKFWDGAQTQALILKASAKPLQGSCKVPAFTLVLGFKPQPGLSQGSSFKLKLRH